MVGEGRDTDAADALARGAPPSGARLLQWWIARGRLDALLVAAWGLWLLAPTQIPQQDAALVTSDGLTIGDWRLSTALGLHRLAGGPSTWLLATTTSIWWLASRRERAGSVVVVATGLYRWTASLAAALLCGALAWEAADPPLERWALGLGDDAAAPAGRAFDGGRLWPAPTPRDLRCSSQGASLQCRAGSETWDLPPARAIWADGALWRWRGVASADAASRFELELHGSLAGGEAASFIVNDAGATAVPALGARVVAASTRRSGQVAIVQVARRPAALLASPGLVAGPLGGTWRASGPVRVDRAELLPTLLALGAALAFAISAVTATRGRPPVATSLPAGTAGVAEAG